MAHNTFCLLTYLLTYLVLVDSPGGALASGQCAVKDVAADIRSGQSNVGEQGPASLPPSVGDISNYFQPDAGHVILTRVRHDGTPLPGPR